MKVNFALHVELVAGPEGGQTVVLLTHCQKLAAVVFPAYDWRGPGAGKCLVEGAPGGV